MSKKYTPTNWVANKTVATADAMNNIEKGIEDAHQDIEILDSQIKEKANKVDLGTQKARIEILDSQIKDIEKNKADRDDVAKISSGTPLFASTEAEMTDITRNYVNISDGYL